MKTFSNYSLYLYTDIRFGLGTETEAAGMIKKHGGSKVLMIYGGGSIKKSGLYDRVAASLREGGIPWVELGGVRPNPRRSLVDAAFRLARDAGVDFILAVGGGSCLDTAKAVGLALASGGGYWQLFTGTFGGTPTMAPVGAIPTIAAAGSETSISCVILDDVETGRKMSVNLPCCRPVFALLNPALTHTVSPYQTAAGAVDILAHTVLRYFFKDLAASRLGDEFAEGLMRTVVRYGPAAAAAGGDGEARAELMMAAAFSHNDITSIGRSGPRGGEHALESQISGHYDTAHGAGLAVVMPAWLQYIVGHGRSEQVARVAQFGAGVFAVRPDLADPVGTANAGLRAFRAWIRSLGMPLTLKELGIPRADLPAVIKRCVDHNKGTVSGFMDLDETAVTEIFTSIIE
jgi:alcohol dehydrogenase YqhD (iron-dependent ADH family)